MSKPPRIVLAPSACAAVALGALPAGCRVVGLTKGQFSLIDILDHVLSVTGPARVEVCTWTVAAKDSDRLRVHLEAGRITELRLIVGYGIRATMADKDATRPEGAALARLGWHRIREAQSHAKFVLVEAGARRFVVRGSMNLNRNRRCEQFDLDDDAEIHRTFRDYVDETFAATPEGLKIGGAATQRAFERVLGGGVAADADYEELHADAMDIVDRLSRPRPVDLAALLAPRALGASPAERAEACLAALEANPADADAAEELVGIAGAGNAIVDALIRAAAIQHAGSASELAADLGSLAASIAR